MIEISTGKLIQRKKVKIDNHIYLVRKLGGGEQLDLSQAVREIKKYENRSDLTDAEEEKLIKLSKKVMDTMADCFDDGEGGSKAHKLINSLAPEELQLIMSQIFEETNEKPSEPEKQIEA